MGRKQIAGVRVLGAVNHSGRRRRSDKRLEKIIYERISCFQIIARD
jgi:hypothetical protein